MKRIVFISLALLCGCSTTTIERQTTAIIELHSIETYNRSVPITDDITIRGQIVANDAYGEFDYTIYVDDQSAGIEILCDQRSIYKELPINAIVDIACSGLHLSNINGTLRLGAAPSQEYTLERLSHEQIARHIRVASLNHEITPPTLTIDQISARHISRLIALDGIHIESEYPTFCQYDTLNHRHLDTSHRIVDSTGASMELRVNGNCKYATSPTPRGAGLVYVIIDHYDGDFTATISNRAYSF